MIGIRDAAFPDDVHNVRDIFRDYAASLGVDLAFQDFDSELAGLPGKYAPPHGAVLLAHQEHTLIGCVALRPICREVCEMKRLYVRPEGRGLRLGRRLAELACSRARSEGYRRIRLDTLPTMAAAHVIYIALGFEPIDAYVFNPVEGTRYLELRL